MMYKGRHTKPLLDRRRLCEDLAMIGVEVVGMIVLFVIWWNV